MTGMDERRTNVFHAISAVQSIAGIGCAAALLGGTKETGFSAIWLVALVLVWVGSFTFWQEKDRRLKICFGLLGFAFSVFCALGMRLDAAQHTGWLALAGCAAAGLCFGAAVGEGFVWLSRMLVRLKTPLKMSEKKAFWVVFFVLLVCWTPVLIAFFPGIDGYDSLSQCIQITTGNYDAHHPLLHTLYLQLCFSIGSALFGSVSLGFGISTVLQAVFVAYALAYAMRYLRRIGCPRILWLVLLALFALPPYHALIVSSSIKDVPFAAVMVLLTIEIIRFLTEADRCSKPAAWIGNILLVCLACLLRNNAVYGFAFLVFLGIVLWRKQLGRSILLVLLAGIIAGVGVTAGLKAVTHAQEGSIREMLVVPFQQLARLHFLYGLEHPVGYEVREVLPYVDDYAPERADAVKRAAKVVPNDRLIRFIKLWLRESIHYPVEYIDAFLLNSKGYWWVNDLSYATTYNFPDRERGCLLLHHNEGTQLEMQDLWPQVKKWCNELFVSNGYQRYPVLWTLLQPAFYTWALAFVMTWACWKRSKAVLLSGALSASYLLTLFLGPCTLIRYQYPLMLCVPMLLGYISTIVKQNA